MSGAGTHCRYRASLVLEEKVDTCDELPGREGKMGRAVRRSDVDPNPDADLQKTEWHR